MSVWQWSWWLKVGDDLRMLVTEYWCGWHLLNVGARHLCIKIVDVGDRNDSNLDHHPKAFTKTFCRKHLSPTSMKPSWESVSKKYATRYRSNFENDEMLKSEISKMKKRWLISSRLAFQILVPIKMI